MWERKEAANWAWRKKTYFQRDVGETLQRKGVSWAKDQPGASQNYHEKAENSTNWLIHV